jgi:hypothetical protein
VQLYLIHGMEVHCELQARAAVGAAGIIVLGIAVVADLADREIDDAVTAYFSGAAIAAAPVPRDLISVVARLAGIDDAIAAKIQDADFLLASALGRGRALHRGSGRGVVTGAGRASNEQGEPR